MMTRITAITALALLAACGSASVTEQEAVAQTKTAARPLSVAGITIGMSATDAKATLTRDGWTVETFPGFDWATTVEEQVRRQRNGKLHDLPRNGIGSLTAKKADEELLLLFRPIPSGANVKAAYYSAPMAGRSPDQVRAQLVQRYGTPGFASPPQSSINMNWCAFGENCRSALARAKPALHAEEDAYHKLKLDLLEGLEIERAWDASVQRAATGGVPVKSSF